MATRSPIERANSLRRRHLGVYVTRHDHGDQRRWNVLRPERSRNRVLHRRQALQIGGDRLGVVRRQMGEVRPGHNREQLAAVRRLAFGDGGDNLFGRPVAEAGFLVRGQVAADKYADAGDPESDLGAREYAFRSPAFREEPPAYDKCRSRKLSPDTCRARPASPRPRPPTPQKSQWQRAMTGARFACSAPLMKSPVHTQQNALIRRGGCWAVSARCAGEIYTRGP